MEKRQKSKVCFPLPDCLLSINRSELRQEQEEDLSLKELFQQVHPSDELENAVPGYFHKDGLLVRKWLPQSDSFVGDAIFQVIIPIRLRPEILHTAHNTTGHLGVKKTYDSVLRYFYWPRLKRDISAYVKTCHTCQTGKTNQCIKPAPWCPVSASSQPFEHRLIDCIGPLPKSKTGSMYLFILMCLSTHYPAAYPLHNITTKSVVKALSQFISVFGIPKISQVIKEHLLSYRMIERKLLHQKT